MAVPSHNRVIEILADVRMLGQSLVPPDAVQVEVERARVLLVRLRLTGQVSEETYEAALERLETDTDASFAAMLLNILGDDANS